MSCVTVSRRTSWPPSYNPNVRETLALPCIALPSSFSDSLQKVVAGQLQIFDRLQHLGDERRSRPNQGRSNRAGTDADRRIIRTETSGVERVVGKLVAVPLGLTCGGAPVFLTPP